MTAYIPRRRERRQAFGELLAVLTRASINAAMCR
jgi:hypothetical protein